MFDPSAILPVIAEQNTAITWLDVEAFAWTARALSHPRPLAEHNHDQNGDGKKQSFNGDFLSQKHCGYGKGDEGLQQLQLPNPCHAAKFQAGIPSEETKIHGNSVFCCSRGSTSSMGNMSSTNASSDGGEHDAAGGACAGSDADGRDADGSGADGRGDAGSYGGASDAALRPESTDHQFEA